MTDRDPESQAETPRPDSEADVEYLRRALDLARPTQPHPNPRVGAVIVSPEGVVLGEGWHLGPGTDHAEVMALAAAGERARGAAMYVTLEPCAHHGRTPPCAEAVIGAGILRVVVGASDPDGRVAGKGTDRLRDAGVDVVEGVLPFSEAEAVDPGYFHHRRTGRPRLTVKAAATLDGNTAAGDFTSQWITSDSARRDGHLLRAQSDAVMVGAGTLLADDPRLDVRIEGYEGRRPRSVVVAGMRPLPSDRAVWRPGTIVLAPGPVDVPAEVVVVPGVKAGAIDLHAALEILGRMEIVDLLVEGGATLIGNLFRTGLVDRGVFYFGSKVGGGSGIPIVAGPFPTLTDAVDVQIVDVRRLGPDVRIEFEREDG